MPTGSCIAFFKKTAKSGKQTDANLAGYCCAPGETAPAGAPAAKVKRGSVITPKSKPNNNQVLIWDYKQGEDSRSGCCAEGKRLNATTCCKQNEKPTATECCPLDRYHDEKGYPECCPAGSTWDSTAQKCPVSYESSTCSSCSCSCGTSKTLPLISGRYEVVVIGAGGGCAHDANGHGSTNRVCGATGGSGASFKGTMTLSQDTTISITVGSGGGTVEEGRGGTGGTSSVGSFISCPGGEGGYADAHRHSTDKSGGSGAAKCTVKSSGGVSITTTTNSGGNSGSADSCKHTDCSKSISGSSPAINVSNHGAVCSGTFGFKSKNTNLPSAGNCGYVKVKYLGQ